MARENTVSFKVFLQSKDDEKPEVRRFGVDRDVVSNFSYLSEKLQNVFPALHGKLFTVTWRDNDGDDVLISTDDELMIALTEIPEDVHKLYVTIKENSPKEHPSKFSGPSHGDVICDVCEKSVFGFRYKCLECNNYDLCSDCESKGYHPEHFMIRLPVPVSWRPHFGKRLAHHLAKSVKRCNGSFNAEEAAGASGEAECPFTRHGYGRGRAHGYHHGNRHASWLDAVSTLLGDFVRHDLSTEGATGSGQKAKESANATANGQTQTSEAGSSKNQTQTSKVNPDENMEYLLNVGKAVASFLDPLGIDVDFKVERNKVPTNAEENKTGEEKAKKNVSFADDKKTDKQNSSPKKEVSPEASIERESPEKDGWTVVHGTDASSHEPATALLINKEESLPVNKNETTSGASESASAPRTEPSTTSASAPASNSTSSATTSTSTSSQTGAYPKTTFPVFYPPAPSFTNIPAPFPPPPPPHLGTQQWPIPPPPFALFPAAPGFPQHQPQPIPQQQQQQQQHQPSPLVQPSPLHSDPKVNQAVEAMMSMGFSNDGGWLTQLVEMKQGDIGKVLDLLQPVKRN